MASSTKLRLENLVQLDGGIVCRAFDCELGQGVQDCLDRPTDNRPRKVAVVFTIKPKVDVKAGEVNCEDCLVEAEVASSMPKKRTKSFTMKPKHSGDLCFHPDLADDPDGDTLYDDDVRERERGERKGE